MTDFIALLCPTCGAKLQVANHTSDLACAYCGNQHRVNRQNGDVHLETMFHDMRSSMDKTSAELAITRLAKEISGIRKEISSVEARQLSEWAPRKHPKWTIAGTIIGIAAFFVTMSSGAFVPMLLSVALLGISLWVYSKRPYDPRVAKTNRQARLSTLQESLSAKERALEHNRQIANG